jgi:hypothetical protein
MSAVGTGIPPRRAAAGGRKTAAAVLLLLGAIGAGAVLFLFNPAQSGFYPYCVLHRSTGLLCPGCGTLRAMHQLLHGELGAAFRCNPLFVLLAPVVAGVFLYHYWRRRNGQPASPSIRPAWLWCALVVLVVFGVLRNLPFAQTAWLAPAL